MLERTQLSTSNIQFINFFRFGISNKLWRGAFKQILRIPIVNNYWHVVC